MSETELKNIFELYQKFTPTTALYPDAGTGELKEVLYLGLGLMGELQEWYQSGYAFKEAGDVFWYCSQVCNMYGWNLGFVYEQADEENPLENPAVNLAETLKKVIREGKDPTTKLFDYMVNTIAVIKYRYNFFYSNKALHDVIESVLLQNRDKLIDRKNRSMLHGDGDDR